MTERDQTRYLAEIQGLRVFAALLVAIYHIWFNRVSGAVDAFFVIAGFFMARSLFKSTIPGPAAIIEYYRRTLTRIAPSMSVVICATCGLFIVIGFESQWAGNIRHAAAALLFVENWWLALTNTDYLAIDQVPSPFQQMWALSVQVQMYLFLPLLLVLLAVLSRLAGLTMLPLLSVGLLASFAYAVVATHQNQPFAYFNTFARLWEFLAGVLVALVFTRVRFSRTVALVLGYACLLVLTFFAAVVPVNDLFPGLAALGPVAATAGIILAAGNGAGMRVLTAPVMQRLGDLSFTFYLWHWPLLVAVWLSNGSREVGLPEGLAIIVAAGVLSWLTFTVVERPFRRSGMATGRIPVALVSVAALLLPAALSIGAWAAAYVDRRDTGREQIAAFRAGEAVTAELIPPFVLAKTDVPRAYEDDCVQRWGAAEPLECRYGRAGGPAVVLVGGSHSAQFLPALHATARANGLEIVTFLKGNCPFTFAADPQLGLAAANNCIEFSTAVAQRIGEIAPAAVVTLLTTSRGVEDGMGESLTPGQLEAIRALGDTPVLAIRDTPRAAFDILDCVERHYPRTEQCDPVYLPEDFDPRALGALPDTLVPLDLHQRLCSAAERRCPAVIDGLIVYRDRTHLSASFAHTLAPDIEEGLRHLGVLED